MKIALIKDNIPFPCANVINFLKLADGFFNLGHEVEILTVHRFLEEKWKLKLKDINNFYDINPNIKIRYFRGNFISYFEKNMIIAPFQKLLKSFPYLHNYIDPEIQISNYCFKKKFDLCLCRGVFRAAKSNILKKISTVLDIHGPESSQLDLIIELRYNKYFKGIITLNNVLKQELIKKGFFREKIEIMENGVNLRKYEKITNNKTKIRKKLNLPLNQKIILYSGGPYQDRGIDTILEAVNILNDEKFSFYFIGGNKKILNTWKKYIIKHNINGNIHFLTSKPKKVIPYFLKAADILLATYNSYCGTIKYMSPVKIVEYMASKVPFIATKVGRVIDICKNSECLLTKPENPKDLSEKIKTLISDENLRNIISRNAYLKAKELTIERRCEKILELMKNN